VVELFCTGKHCATVAVCIAQSNVIEAAPDMQRESEKEWYYGNADKERLGPYSFDEVTFTVDLSQMCRRATTINTR